MAFGRAGGARNPGSGVVGGLVLAVPALASDSGARRRPHAIAGADLGSKATHSLREFGNSCRCELETPSIE